MAGPGARADMQGAWNAVLLLSLVYLCGLIDRIVLSLVLVPLQRDLAISDTQVGLLAGAAFGLSYVAASIPLGFLADRANRRNLVILALLFWSIMTLGCGLATSFGLLFLFRMGVGIGEAVQTPCASSMIGDLFSPKRRPVAFGVYLTSGALGISLAFLLGGTIVQLLSHAPSLELPLLGKVAGWRATLMISAIAGLVLAPLLVALLREPQRTFGAAERAVADWRGFADFLRTEARLVLGIVVAIPILTSGIYTFVNWMPVYFARIHHWPAGQSGLVFAVTCGVAALLGSVATGFLPRFLVRCGVAAPVLPACLFCGLWANGFGALAMLAPNALVTIVLLTLSFLGLMSTSVLALAAINEIVPARYRASFTALFTVGIGLFTNSLGPFMVGYLTDHLFGAPGAIDRALLLVWVGSAVLGGGLLWPALRIQARPVLAPGTSAVSG